MEKNTEIQNAMEAKATENATGKITKIRANRAGELCAVNTTEAKATKAAYDRTPTNGSNWVEIVPGPADFAAGFAVPDAPNHGDVFAAATVVKAFFDTAYQMVKDAGSHQRWYQTGRAQAAATLAHACATVYAAQLSERQRKPSQRNPKKTAP